MKKHLLLLLTIVIVSTTTVFAQVFDSIGVISPDYEIEDMTSKGTTLFAALGQGGVWFSEDEGFTWSQTSPFPDSGFGDEAAFSIYAASNGDLIVGGNLLYNNAPLSGVVFRSSDNGVIWSAENLDGLGGYEESGKIVELSNGNLMMRGGQGKLFTSTLTNPVWTQTNSPGGVIFGFEQINDEIFVVNNPAGGTAGTWTTLDMGQTWQRYGGNGTPVGSGTVTLAPVIKCENYKFIGIGGTYDPRGMYRSGVNDTLWVEKNNGLGDSGIYPICMATDDATIWMVFQGGSGGCKFSFTNDYGDSWEEPVEGLPLEGGSNPCPEKMIVFGADLYTYANESVYRKEDVAVPAAVGKQTVLNNSMTFYPNPVNNAIQARLTIAIDNGSWEVLNLNGQILNIGQFTAAAHSSLTIDVGRLESGFYILKVNTDIGVQTHKFVKQ